MKGYLNLAAAHPWSVIVVVLLVSMAAGSQLHNLQIHVSPRALAIENDAEKEIYERSLETFGSDNVTLVVVRDRDLFGRDTLEAIRSAIARIESLPFVERTESLFSLPHVRVVDEFVHTSPYLDKIPVTVGHAEAIRKAALENPFVRRNLLSDDGTTLAINVHLSRDLDEPEFDAQAATGLEAVIDELRPGVDEAYQIGMPYVRTFVRDAIYLDQQIVLPLAVIVLVLSLTIFLRGATAAIPLLTAALSVLWVMGGMAALGIPVTVMTAIVPVLIVIIGSTEDIHLIAEYREAVANGQGRIKALRQMARQKGLAVALTFLTSCLGFLVVVANPIPLLRELGLVASAGLLLNFAITAALVPVCLRYFGERGQHQRTIWVQRNRDRFVRNASRLVTSGKPWILLFTLLVVAISINGVLSLRLNNNIRDYLPEDSLVERRTDDLHRTLSGMESFSIILESGIEGTFQKSRYLQDIVELQGYLHRQPAFDSSLSLADHLALLNSAVNDSGEIGLPDDDLILAELTSFTDPRHLAGFVTPDFSRTRIFVRHDLASSNALNEALGGLKAFIANHVDEGLSIDITGESVLSNHAADLMAAGQAKSLGLMLLAVFGVVSLLFLNSRAGLIAVLTNAFPLVVLFGVMGYAGIPLDSGTSMIAVVALGICVDNTMHFLVRYNREMRRHPNEMDAIEETIRGEVIPITASAMALSLGLGALAFSSFAPISHFGILSSMVILLAFYSNFFITPILLSASRLTTLWELLSFDLRSDLACNCLLFKGMRPHEIRRVILAGRMREYKAGESIMHRGDTANEMFVLLEGHGSLATGGRGSEAVPPLSLSAGDVFGLTAMVSCEARIASVSALSPCKVLVMSRDSIQRLARFRSYTAFKLYRNLSAIIGARFAKQVTGIASEDKGSDASAGPSNVAISRPPRIPRGNDQPSLRAIQPRLSEHNA